MNICIFGAGAIGGMIASLFKRAGMDITIVARGAHFEAINKKGLIFQSKEYDLDICQSFKVVPDINDLEKFDIVISGLKAHSSNQTAKSISEILHKKSMLVTTVNGIPWWFFYKFSGQLNNYQIKSVDPQSLQWEYIRPERVIGSVVYPAALVAKPGLIKHLEGKRIILGEPDNSKSERIQELSKIFFAAGIKSPASKSIREDIWLKLIGNSSLNPISVILNSTLKEMCEQEDTISIIANMMKEIEEIGNKLDLKLKLDIEKRIDGAKKVGDHKTSTLQDYLMKKPIELDALTGSIIEIAEILGCEVPVTDTIYKITKYLAIRNKCFPG